MPSIIIIGSGPAGISAALYAVRAGVDTMVLTKGPGALDRAEKIENYYGFAEPVSGAELERRSIENAKRLGVRFVTAEAVGLTYTDKLTVETVDKNYPADAVILATGASRAVHYAKGARVHSPLESCVGILLLRSGQLRAYLLSEDGRDVTLYRLFGGEVCILSASCVMDSVNIDLYIDAEEDTEAYCISAGIFRRLMQQNVHVRCYAYQMTAERFSDSMWTMQQVLFMSADRRLAIFLTDELAKTGGDEVRMTHDQMAKYMGSAREVVSRMLKYFAQEGWVRLFRGGVQVLDRKKLQQLARGE